MSRTQKYFAVSIALVLTAYISVCALLYFTQRSYLYFPQPRRSTSVPAIQLPGVDATVVVSTVSRPGSRAVIYFGGNAEDVSRSVPLLSETFASASIFAMNYRGYGGSTGEPTEKALVTDAIALFDLVHEKYSEITLIGRSLGSGIAIQVAARRPSTHLVLVTPYNSISELAARQFPYLPTNLLVLDRYESWRFAPAIAVPTTVIAAGEDQVIPKRSTLRLLTFFKPGIATLTVIAGVGHNDISSTNEYVAALRSATR